jgi:hypothetical protein
MWISFPVVGFVFTVCFFALCLPVATSANDLPVDLELVLAVDISASMSPDEQKLQRKGYIDAFRSQRVLQAVRSGAFGRIAVAYVEWADAGNQNIVVPWMLLDDADSIRRFADALALVPIGRDFRTSISEALLFSRDLFEGNGFSGERKAIDLSANGPNNRGPAVETARDMVVADGVTINGLPIMTRLRWGGGLYSIAGLDFYFEDCVIGGPGAFVVAVRNLKEFAATIERKLILEIAALPNQSVMLIAEVSRPKKMDCMAGERSSGHLLPSE